MSLHARVKVEREGFTLDVDMTISAGETVAILGPNGAGKTTLLRAIAGLVPMTGHVELDGDVVDDSGSGRHVPTEKRRIGLVFQEHVLFPHMTALENVAFGLGRDGRRAAMDWLERVGLASRANARPAELSGGEAQRVALIRTMATRPRVLLLDEPLSALDVSVRAEVRRELARQLAGFTGVRILVTHDPLEAMALADRLVVLEKGKIVQSGPPADVTARPRSRFVADLAGVNLLRGRAHDDHIEVEPGGAVIAAPDAGHGEVFAVIHPRAVALYLNRPDGTPRNVWRGRAEELELLGERVRVRVAGPVPLVAEVTPSAVRDLHLAAGADVWVSVKATEISVYPA